MLRVTSYPSFAHPTGSWLRRAGELRSFSLIEIMVTLAIIGMLTVTILPTLGRYNRTNNVVISAQSLREALGEARSYAVSPDPTICPALVPITRPINQYALFLPSPATATNTPVYDPNPGGTVVNYECGIGKPQVLLATNQFAILARSLGTDATGTPVEYTIGIVRIGSLDNPAVANVPIQGAAARAMLVGFKSPSGSFFSTAIAGFNYVPNQDDVILLPNGSKTTREAAAKQYSLLGIAEQYPSPTYSLTTFISNTTGQVTSNGSTPSGFN